MTTDEELVAQVNRGESGAFDELVRRHYGMVWRIARQFVSISEDADDLTQEAFMTAYEQLQTLEQPERFRAWLAVITRNVGRMWRRNQRSQPALLPLDDDREVRPEVMAASVEATREAAQREDIRQAVAHALAALKPEHHQASRLHYLFGYNYGETAALLNIPVAALRGRLHRARGALRKELCEMKSKQEEKWELGERDLDALRAAAAFASEELDRALINALRIDEGGWLVTTDAFRVFCYRSAALSKIPPLLIHADLGRKLRSECPEARHAWLVLRETEAVLKVNGSKEISAPLVDGEFPSWEKIIPETWASTAFARAGDWLRALELLARQRQTNPSNIPETPETRRTIIVPSLEDGRIILRQGTEPPAENGSADVRLRILEWEASFPARFEIGNNEVIIAADAAYLEEAIRCFNLPANAEVEFAMNPPMSGFLLRPAGNVDFLVVTAPMQLPSTAIKKTSGA